MDSSTVAEEVKRVLRSFEILINACSGQTKEHGADLDLKAKFEDEFDRFKLWTGNIGAHRRGQSSLDYRLRDASHIRERVLQLLAELLDATSQAYQITSGKQIPWDEISDSDDETESPIEDTELDFSPPSGSELQAISSHVEETTRCLLRLSMTIQNPSPHDRFLKASSIDTSYYEAHDIDHVRSKFPDASPLITERLGKAISWRRQFIKYSEAHRKRYKSGLDNNNGGIETQSTIASSLPNVTKLGAYDPENSDAVSQTSFATSVAGDDKLKVPPMPDGVDYDDEFECPLCYYIVSVKNRDAWKRHVLNDLQPYVCPFENCTTPHKAFTTRHSWQSHLENHPVSDAICPLCKQAYQSVYKWRSHLGKEMQQLALFAIPKELYGNGKDEDDENDEGSRSEHNSEALELKQTPDEKSSSKDIPIGYTQDPASLGEDGKNESLTNSSDGRPRIDEIFKELKEAKPKEEKKDEEEDWEEWEEEWELKLKLKKQKEKEEQKEKEKEIEEEMHKKLAAFGFQENQIEAVLNPKKVADWPAGYAPSNPRPAPHRATVRTPAPTYIKVSRVHLDIETLKYYNLRYEIDANDSNYIIILEEISEDETQMLFEHTRKLRRGKTSLIEERDRGRDHQYAFVRKRNPSKSPAGKDRDKIPIRGGLNLF